MRRRVVLPAAAVPAELPASLEPELATPVDRPLPGDWIYEIKFDGYRMLARIGGPRDVRIVTRRGNDWTHRFAALHKALVSSKLPAGWYDGEIVLLDDSGKPTFHGLQNAIEGGTNDAIVFYLFDVPYFDGHDLRRVPVEERRALLQSVLQETDRLRFSQEIGGDAAAILQSACHLGLEGVIGKRRGSIYVQRRSDDWIKLKCVQPFKGLREDKAAPEVVREVPEPAAPALLKVTHGSRVIDPSTGLTKLDMVRYYAEVSPWALPHLRGRPAYIKRAPLGIGEAMVFQQHPEGLRGLRGTDPKLWPGHDPAIAFDTAEDLVAAAQLGMIELHTWSSTGRAIRQPDRMIFDLDPGEDVAWPQVQEAALLMRTLLQELGLESWLKTTGGKGLHLFVPLAPDYPYETMKDFSEAIVQHMARTIPQRFVAKSGPRNRVGRIFIDYLRNGWVQSTAEAYSARARPGLGVSMPVRWEELPALTGGDHWNIVTAPQHLAARKADPWAAYWKTPQKLTNAMQALGFQPSLEGTPMTEKKKPGLYANIHAKQERIAHGSGEKMRKAGEKGAPAARAFEKAARTTKAKKKSS